MPYKKPGFSEELELLHAKETDYQFLGATKIPDEILIESGYWVDYEPPLEIQKNNIGDPYSCVTMAILNTIEMITDKKYGIKVNYSDRFIATLSGTIPGRGNSAGKVAETIRAVGLVEESLYPFPSGMTLKEYYKTVAEDVKKIGVQWLDRWVYMHENVKKQDFKEALKRSPVTAAVDSRTNKAASVKGFDHYIVITGFKNNKWIVFDSYLNRFREYDASYNFSYGKKHYVEKKSILKVVDPLTKTEHLFELVKPDIGEKIYLKDSDGILHHIETPDAFFQVFGQKAFNEKWWSVVPFTEIDVMPKGKSIAIKPETVGEAISSLLSVLGVNKNMKLVHKYPALGSSQNPEELSLTVKGVVLSLVPLLVILLGSLGVSVVQTDLVEFINSVFAVVSACIIAFGLGRKLIKK